MGWRTFGKESERSKKKNERSERVKKAVAEEVGQVIENPDLNDKQRLFACITFDASTLQKPTRKRTVVIMQRRHLSDIDCWRKMELEPKSSA